MKYSQMEIARFITARKNVNIETARKAIQRHPDVIPVVSRAMAKLGIKPVKSAATTPSYPPAYCYGAVRLSGGRLWVLANLMGERVDYGPEHVAQYGLRPVQPTWVPATATFLPTGVVARIDVDEPFRSSAYSPALPVSERNHTGWWPKDALYSDDWWQVLSDLYGDDSPLETYNIVGAYTGDGWDNSQIDAVREAMEAGDWRYVDGAWMAGEV